MSEKKELNIEELEKVSGGEGEQIQVSKLTIYFYRQNSNVEEKEDVDFEFTGMRLGTQDEADAKKWCTDNNYRYSRFTMRELLNSGIKLNL